MSLKNTEDCRNLEEKWSCLSEKEKITHGCVLIHILSHLNSNLKSAENDPTYRKREQLRTKIALKTIKNWKKDFEHNYKELS